MRVVWFDLGDRDVTRWTWIKGGCEEVDSGKVGSMAPVCEGSKSTKDVKILKGSLWIQLSLVIVMVVLENTDWNDMDNVRDTDLQRGNLW